MWELALLVEKERLSLDRELLEWVRDALAVPRVELLAMTPSEVATAHQPRGALAGDPGDRLIVATALVEGVFTQEARAARVALVDLLKRLAQRKQATPAHIALAWLLAQDLCADLPRGGVRNGPI